MAGVARPAVQFPPLRWWCPRQISPPLRLSSSPAAVLSLALALLLALLLGLASGSAGRYDNLCRVFRLLCLHVCRLCRRRFGCRCDDLRGARCCRWGWSAGSTAATLGGGFVAISGALQTCVFKQIASLNFCRYIGGGALSPALPGKGLHSARRRGRAVGRKVISFIHPPHFQINIPHFQIHFNSF